MTGLLDDADRPDPCRVQLRGQTPRTEDTAHGGHRARRIPCTENHDVEGVVDG